MISVVRAVARRRPLLRRHLPQPLDPFRRSHRLLAAAGAAVLFAALLVILLSTFGHSHAAKQRAVPTALARVVRTDVIERQQVSGTLGFRGSYAVMNGAAAGVVTALPSAGAIVHRGQPLYELDGRPVILFYGYRPAYRDFSLGMSGGPDVVALKENLRALGIDSGGALTASDRFDVATLAAVESWQRSLGLPVSGSVSLGEVVFLPGPVRVSTTTATVGAYVAAAAPVLSATSANPAVLVPLDPGSVSQLKVGDHVLVTMPDNSTVPGHVAAIGRVASASGASDQGGGQPSTPTIPVTVALNRQSQSALDQAPVQVAITAQEDRNVLAVPISALLAQPGGGYAVEVKSGNATRLVTVATGLFDDVASRVEVSGPGLRAGMHVEVPTG